MTTPIPLFDAIVAPRPRDPSWLATPVTPLEQKFKAFHEQNVGVFTALERHALHEARHGATRLSIAKMAEQLRADPSVASIGDAFKINNSFRAFYARLLIHRHPELGGKFELRERRERNPDTEGLDA